MILGALALIASMTAAQAEVKPRPFPEDPRIRHYSYSEHQVYRLDVYMKFITAVQFAPGENVESVQVGDSASWQIVRLARGDVLSVKPLIENAFTNMTVYTDRRVYTFELRAKRGRVGDPNLSYRISFRYPAEEAEQQRVRQARAALPKDLNYFAAGSPGLMPMQVYDDGQKTYFRFPANAPRPAVFAADANGRESIVNTSQTSDGFIVGRVSARWTLRLGDENLSIAHGSVAHGRSTASTRLVQTRGDR
ncbi:TrbG/VirB9 family P-type conjugative transfer protein (plasmid) [Acuticoccus sp. MNP-M23]|uniref:TrbG/VirB9 family P-type conjugative transfer protein n=1 Tax=Acuticoccus sp. MNP-M23 TaxID=3072793 RepID=UPI0028151424|nr:TrbG/VirB9 family P-type conjugative transfer protein [Acuticoccus sp. MNP-M23]WMS45227.1 TrbG/VirB9 family P-type conjugative transfer protein [Acuticoccus sp. MNP-M23]